MPVRGIRGATTVDNNTIEDIVEATVDMLKAMIDENDINVDDVASATFSTTRDLNAEFPAFAARVHLGWEYVALMCHHEMDVPKGLPMCIRVMVLINTDKSPQEINNIYQRGAVILRDKFASKTGDV